MTSEQQIFLISNEIDTNDKINILLVLPESAGDIFESLKTLYPESYIYYACNNEYTNILYENPYIYKTITYYPIMDNQIIMEGVGEWKGLFDISIMLNIFTQKYLNYLNNGIGKIAFNLRKESK